MVIFWKGKQHEWVVKGSKRDGDEFEALKRLEFQAKAGEVERRVAVSFFELSVEYAAHAKAHLKASTWQSRKFQIDALTTHMGEVRVTELGPGYVDSFKRARDAEKLKASSINNELRVFGTVLRWGREMGHRIPLFRWKRLPERGEKKARAFSDEEIERIFAACREKAPSLLPLLIFLLNTGMRKGEALACEWSWVDFGTNMLHIPSTEYWQPKSGKGRDVPMSDATRALLSAMHADPKRDARWVFTHRFGGRLAQFPKELWSYVTKEAKLTGGPHQLRHTYASHFLRNGGKMRTLADILGHSQTRITEIYSHLLPGELEHARNTVNITPKTMVLTLAKKKKRA